MCYQCNQSSCNSCCPKPECVNTCVCTPPDYSNLGCPSYVDPTCIILKKDYPCLNLVKGQNFDLLLDKLETLACLSNISNCNCSVVTGFAVQYDQRGLNDVTKYRVKLLWQPVLTATSYIVQYKQSNSTIWQSLTTTTITSYSSLIVDSTFLSYDFRIKAVCGNCESVWLEKLDNVITPCAAPTNAYYNPIDNTLVWTSTPNQDPGTFVVEMRRDDQVSFTTINVVAVETPAASGIYIASLNSINFSLNYVYHFCISNLCGSTTNTYSDHGSGCAFDCAIPNQSNPTVGVITLTTAVINWTLVTTVFGYRITYTNNAITNTITVTNATTVTLTGLNTALPTTVTVKPICNIIDGSSCGGKSVTF